MSKVIETIMPSKKDSNHDEDGYLVKLCREGNKENKKTAFEKLFIKYQQKVFTQCYWLLLDKMEAEQAAQDIFMKAYRGIEGFRGESSEEKAKFSTWLYKITRNHCLNKLNRSGRIRQIDGEDQEQGLTMINLKQKPSMSSEDSRISTEVGECVNKKVTQLNEMHRSVVDLVHFQGLSYEDAAEILDCPVGTIRSRLNRALDRLKPMLKECYELLK